MHKDPRWLEQTATPDNSDSRWPQDSHLDESQHGVCISPWFLTTGPYPNQNTCSTDWTPQDDRYEASQLTCEVHGITDIDGFLSDVAIEHELLQPAKSRSALQWDDLGYDHTSHLQFFGSDLSLGHSTSLDNTIEEHADGVQNCNPRGPSVAVHGSSCLPDVVTRTSARPKLSPTMPRIAAPITRVEKTFHFVANSDKKTATRLRNTMTSRNLRQSKMSRIAQLEKELEKQKKEVEMWKRRAIEGGWKNDF